MIGISELKRMYENAWKLFVQPAKRRYNPKELSENPAVIIGSLMYVPFNIKNSRAKNIKCHAFIPTQSGDFQNMKINIIVYAHAQGSNALEGSFLIPICDKLGIGLCLFDFSGSGNSEGDFVTLGISEADDLALVIHYLQTNYKIQKIGLWGRSMGAVSSIIYAERVQKNIAFAVYDVPFYELENSGVYFAKKKLKVSPFLTKIVLNFISNKIQQEIGYDVFSTKTGDICKNIMIPAVLIASRNDELVPFEDFEKLLKEYGSKKIKMIITEKSHSDHRESDIVGEATLNMVNGLLNTKYNLEEIHILMKKNYSEQTAKRYSIIKDNITNSLLPNSDLNAVLRSSNGLCSPRDNGGKIGSIRKYSSIINSTHFKRDMSLIPINRYREKSNVNSRMKSPKLRESKVKFPSSRKPSVFTLPTDNDVSVDISTRNNNDILHKHTINNNPKLQNLFHRTERSKSPLQFDVRYKSKLSRRY